MSSSQLAESPFLRRLRSVLRDDLRVDQDLAERVAVMSAVGFSEREIATELSSLGASANRVRAAFVRVRRIAPTLNREE